MAHMHLFNFLMTYLSLAYQVTRGMSKEEYAQRRTQLLARLPQDAIVIVPSYKLRYASQNIFYPFQQSNYLYYLTGFLEPESCLVLCREQTVMLVQEDSPSTVLWTGPVAGLGGCMYHFGIDSVLPNTQISEYIATLLANKPSAPIYAALDENSSFLGEIINTSRGRPKFMDVRSTIQQLRVTKSAQEIAVLQEAGQVSSLAFKETMRKSACRSHAHSDFYEAQIAATMEYECRLRGAQGLAYVPVVAGGPRANILHYTRNDQIIRAGDMVLMDAGGMFNGYCSDISRTWPINRKFNNAQRVLYAAVLRVQTSCIAACKAAIKDKLSLDDIHNLSVSLMTDELGKLGFLDPETNVHNLYPHSIGHYIGLDLHDCQQVSTSQPLLAGTSITIEPGLYIPEHETTAPLQFRGMGIRIEDDLVIDQQDGVIILTEQAPKEIEEIENLLHNID